MTVSIESIAAALANDTALSDDELIRLINDLHATGVQTNVVDLEKYRIRKVLEACARLRDLEMGGPAAVITHLRPR